MVETVERHAVERHTVERRLGEDMLKLEPDLPAGEGPAEGSFGEPTDVFRRPGWQPLPHK